MPLFTFDNSLCKLNKVSINNSKILYGLLNHTVSLCYHSYRLIHKVLIEGDVREQFYIQNVRGVSLRPGCKREKLRLRTLTPLSLRYIEHTNLISSTVSKTDLENLSNKNLSSLGYLSECTSPSLSIGDKRSVYVLSKIRPRNSDRVQFGRVEYGVLRIYLKWVTLMDITSKHSFYSLITT